MALRDQRKLVRCLRDGGLVVQLEAVQTLLAYFDDWAAAPAAPQSRSIADFADLVAATAAQHVDKVMSAGSILDSHAADLLCDLMRRKNHLDSSARLRDDSMNHSGTDDDNDEDPLAGGMVQVIDAFDVPTPVFSDANHSFSAASTAFTLCGRPEDKAHMFRLRYNLLLQRQLRDDRFCPPVTELAKRRNPNHALQLAPIESLLGSSGPRFIFGMLTQLQDGVWYLEDLNASIELDLSDAQYASGFHTENSFVVAAGHMTDTAVFKVLRLGSPNAETKPQSNSALANANLFGGVFHESDRAKLELMESENPQVMFFFFSDVWLDQTHVLDALNRFLQQCAENDIVPSVIVLMGAFLSHPFGQTDEDIHLLMDGFSNLAKIISKYPAVAETTHFVLVPGTTDPGPGHILPRGGLPAFIIASLAEQVSNVTLASNPCRIRYCAQEIVVFREDLTKKMIRNAVHPIDHQEGEMSENLVMSVLDQAHLCPIPTTARPVVWKHDPAMWLFPVPDVLVLGERADGYNWEYKGCKAFNPGSFPNDQVFFSYSPGAENNDSRGRVEPCCVPRRETADANPLQAI